jgi:hypothetical protein
LIICHTSKELQPVFGLCLSKMAITVEMCLCHLCHLLHDQLMCWWLRLVGWALMYCLSFYNYSKSSFANAWTCNTSHESLVILLILDEFLNFFLTDVILNFVHKERIFKYVFALHYCRFT